MRKFVSRLNGTERSLHYDASAGQFQIDGEAFAASVSFIAPERYSIVMDGASFDVRVAVRETGAEGVEYVARVGEVEYHIEPVDPRQWRRGGSASLLAGAQRITAPMPGKVVRVLVAAGQPVEPGQGLIVVEAMKMQNEIKSPKAGTVGKLSATVGQTVAAGQELVVIE